MDSMPLLNDVKTANRILSNDPGIEGELQDLIEAALLDLNLSGVSVNAITEDPLDPLIKRAVILYTKAHFGFGNDDFERLQQSYLMLKQHLCLSGDYNATLE